MLKLANVVDPPPSLVNCAFGLLICDVLPPGVRVNAKRLALAMVASPEKYRSRRDQQRLTKYFESIDKESFYELQRFNYDVIEMLA